MPNPTFVGSVLRLVKEILISAASYGKKQTAMASPGKISISIPRLGVAPTPLLALSAKMSSTAVTKGGMPKAVQAELERILGSPLFAHATRQRRFLEFIVTETISGRSDQLSGYTIAVRVFDRNPDFDPALDPVVRVGAARLRAKLREYYDDKGRSDPIRIGLEKGSYTATICRGGLDAGGGDPVETSAKKPSLVVLPFDTNGTISGHDSFADGLTKDLITDLSKLRGLFLVLLHSSQECSQTARRLGVRYLLEGNVRHAGERIRVSARLVNAVSSQILLGTRYDCKLGDDFLVQEELARNIVRAIKLKLTEELRQVALAILPPRDARCYGPGGREADPQWLSR